MSERDKRNEILRSVLAAQIQLDLARALAALPHLDPAARKDALLDLCSPAHVEEILAELEHEDAAKVLH